MRCASQTQVASASPELAGRIVQCQLDDEHAGTNHAYREGEGPSEWQVVWTQIETLGRCKHCISIEDNNQNRAVLGPVVQCTKLSTAHADHEGPQDLIYWSSGDPRDFLVEKDLADTPRDLGPEPISWQSFDRWWTTTAQADYDAFGPKMAEYGSTDLEEIGRMLCHLMGWEDAGPSTWGEVGCFFYLYGKIQRRVSAYRRHELPSGDTLHDETVYSLMGRGYRERGTLQ